MILFSEIFNRAVILFDDPDIRQRYESDPVAFQQIMRPLLVSAYNRWTYPTGITDKLKQISDAVGYSESDHGDGTASYTLVNTPVPNASICYYINNERVDAVCDDGTVTFERNLTTEDTWMVKWYYAGAFTADFSDVYRSDFPMDVFMEYSKEILAHCILAVWSDQEMNRALEIRNIFSDSDLGFYSPASSAKAKVDWHNQINKDLNTLISDLNWRIMSTPRGGSRFGK